MTLKGAVVALTVMVVFIIMPVCPMWASAPRSQVDHNCHGEQSKHQEPSVRACCEDEVLVVSTFHAVEGLSVDLRLSAENVPGLTSAMFSLPCLNQAFPLDTGTRLAELSLLRI